MKVVFLDIDGVLQPHGRQDRFDYIRSGEALKMTQMLNEQIKDRGDYDYYGEVQESSGTIYDIAAVYYDWDKKAVALLKELLDRTGAKIVISSDWREGGYRRIAGLLAIHGLKKYLVDSTWYYPYDKIDYKRKTRTERDYLSSSEVFGAFRQKYPRESDSWFESGVDSRTIEIREYLDRHPEITNFVAIDDRDLTKGLDGHFVKTRSRLTEEEYKKALAILESPDDGPFSWPVERGDLDIWREEWLWSDK